MQPNFLDVHSKRVKGHGHKLQGGKFQLEISGKKVNMRVVRHCNRRFVKSPSLEIESGQGPEQPCLN